MGSNKSGVTKNKSAHPSCSQRDLRYGDRGDDVKNLQNRLNVVLGRHTHPIPETGYFGDMTQRAVQQVQRRFHIHTSPAYFGYVGPRTRAALNIHCVVITVTPPPASSSAAPSPPSSPPPTAATQPPSAPQSQTQTSQSETQTSEPPKAWSWFNVGLSLQGQVQYPAAYAVAAQVMPTLRLKPFRTPYFARHETHVELGLGLNYSLDGVIASTDPRHGISIVTQAALVDPFSSGNFHSQFFAQAGMAINGIPSTPGQYDWRLTHYVLQLQGGAQGSYDLIENRWNLFLQVYGGWQDDFTGKMNSGLVGAAVGTQVTF
jgi:peptidoglycan hydrolase-like protein with peptidoglycan-binding domain